MHKLESEIQSQQQAAESPTTGSRFERFCAIIARLRAPGGCPWDAQQTHASIARNLIEESHEALDAIEHNNIIALREELGDVLLQVVFQSCIAAEADEFKISDVLDDIINKMIRRHPHVFGAEESLAALMTLGESAHFSAEQMQQIADIHESRDAGDVLDLWDQIKLVEKQARFALRNAHSLAESDRVDGLAANTNASASLTPTKNGLLDGVPRSLPALMQAQDISRKAVSAGFEWPNQDAIWKQVYSEIDEFTAEDIGSDAAAEEFGDVLFSLVNIARVNGIDAETALRKSCAKFRHRWALMEQYALNEGKTIEQYMVLEQEQFWQKAKKESLERQAQ
ncbi:MAG: nucleoside triphosphate pyrophosphohydrolase [Coriobacteriales bacterium]|jgi:tetrapyrrole methylase family protein/MazG family protein|nr:nucleoside triphosphate pyrophosphohydrolase [Coriobacteriales bacterium]